MALGFDERRLLATRRRRRFRFTSGRSSFRWHDALAPRSGFSAPSFRESMKIFAAAAAALHGGSGVCA